MQIKSVEIGLRPVRGSDYAGLIALWRSNGIRLRAGDGKDGIMRLLSRNPGLSVAAVSKGKLVGAAMGAWDGRRGWIHHLAIEKGYRRRGVASMLVSEIERRMRKKGVLMVKVEIYNANKASIKLFTKNGYSHYDGLATFGKTLIKSAGP